MVTQGKVGEWYKISQRPSLHRLERSLFDPKPLEESGLSVERRVTFAVVIPNKVVEVIEVKILGFNWNDHHRIEHVVEGEVLHLTNANFFVALCETNGNRGVIKFLDKRFVKMHNSNVAVSGSAIFNHNEVHRF